MKNDKDIKDEKKDQDAEEEKILSDEEEQEITREEVRDLPTKTSTLKKATNRHQAPFTREGDAELITRDVSVSERPEERKQKEKILITRDLKEGKEE